MLTACAGKDCLRRQKPGSADFQSVFLLSAGSVLRSLVARRPQSRAAQCVCGRLEAQDPRDTIPPNQRRLMIRRTITVLSMLLFLSLSAPLRAQEQEAPQEQAPQAVAGPDRSNARATMRSFLTAMADAAQGKPVRIDDAVACLDMASIPSAVRTEQGRELVYQLKQTLDRIRLIQYEEIPDDPEGNPYVFVREAQGEIVINRSPLGLWLFTQATVESIPDLFRANESRELVEGVVEAPRYLSPSATLRAFMPAWMRRVGFILEHWQWLALLVLSLLGVIADRAAFLFLMGVARGIRKRKELKIDTDLMRDSVRPFGLLAMAALWWFLLPLIGLPSQVAAVLVVATRFLAAASAVWGVYRLVDVAASALGQWAAKTENTYDDLLVPIFRTSAKVFVAAFGLVFLADSLDLPIGSLLTGLGLGGLAFALAAQDLVKNFFGSLTVILEHPFKIGDWVRIQGMDGSVEEVGFRSTRIRTFYDSQITLPNSMLVNNAVDNFGARRYRRWSTTLAVTYDTPAEKIESFCEGIRELIRRHPYTRKDYFHVYMNSFGPASLDIMLYVFWQAPNWSVELRERHRLCLDILRLAAQLEIEFAFPTQTLYLRRDAESEIPEMPRSEIITQAEAEGRRRAGEIVDGQE